MILCGVWFSHSLFERIDVDYHFKKFSSPRTRILNPTLPIKTKKMSEMYCLNPYLLDLNWKTLNSLLIFYHLKALETSSFKKSKNLHELQKDSQKLKFPLNYALISNAKPKKL
jgi:hypothetical protein